ncbi:hypothetical protein VTN49DRAFT_6418 [Thermomyces lanuginosus]|uniref:uncharacterized protein n=1 Tax=Thermomyces lanuginosus TaxID=5541 RepID=UPI003742DC7A
MGRNQTPELWTPRIRNDDDDEGDDVDDVDRQNKLYTFNCSSSTFQTLQCHHHDAWSAGSRLNDESSPQNPAD